MKRIVLIALGVIVFLLAALLIGPSFVDWNKYKPQIVEQAKVTAGYDIKIDGDILLHLIPSPQLSIEGLTVAAPRGNEPVLLNMKRADVSVSVLPLIGGKIVVDTVRFVNPDIRLETLPDGSNNWLSDTLSAKQEVSAEPGQIPSTPVHSDTDQIALNKIEIKDGRIDYTNRQSGVKKSAEAINMGMKADSLSGPFEIDGSLTHGGKVIEIEGEVDKIKGEKKEAPVDLSVSLPESNATASFKGVIATEPSMDVQGQMDIKADNLAAVIAVASGGEPIPALAQKLSFSGLVTANEQTLMSNDVEIEFGGTKGSGRLQVMNLKERDPVQILADMVFKGTVNLDALAGARKTTDPKSVEERVAKGEKLSTGPSFIPETLSLPMPIDADVKIVADTIQSGGKTFKGVTAQLVKKSDAFDVNVKLLEMPGKTAADASIHGKFATASKSGDKGVTYADPSVTFTAEGNSEQLPTLLRAFAPEQEGNAALEIWKTAQFNLTGTITPKTVSVKNSTVKLDESLFGLSAAYTPQGSGGKPDVALDVTSDTINIDQIMGRLSGQKKQAVQAGSGEKVDLKKSLEPVREINIPVNLTLDLSAQKAIYNAQQISGIRIKGKASGGSLSIDNASAQDYMGGAVSLQGTVADLAKLSGIDLKFYARAEDAKSFLQSFKIDTSKLPQQISAAEANIAAKGQADKLMFDVKVTALQGEVKASGTMTGLLDKPGFSNLTIGAKHPNFVKAMQIVNPDFNGGAGLERPFEFNAKAVKSGDTYDLSDFKANLGPTTVSGSLKVTPGDKNTVTGNVTAGDVPLDSLLGAKSAAKGGSGGGSSAQQGGEKWSRETIDTPWMQSTNIDLDLKAQSITYGGWNFTSPSTKITLKDGTLIVDNLKAGLFSGNATLNAKVQDPADARQPLTMAVQTKMENVALEPLAYALSGAGRLKASGDVNLDLDVTTSGLSSYALVSGLKGKAHLNGTDVILKGFDLAQLALAFVDTGKPLDRLNSLVGGATAGGETRFDTVKGNYDINAGIVAITGMMMDGPAASITSTGNANLPAWTIDTNHKVVLKQAKDQEGGTFNVAIKGPLSSPGNTFGKAMFNDIITRRAQQKVQEKVIEKLDDVIGDKLGDKLQGLGILPKKAAPAPAATPAAPALAPGAVAPAPETPAGPAAAPEAAAPAAEPQAAPAPAPEEEQSEGEKALNSLIEGLGGQ